MTDVLLDRAPSKCASALDVSNDDDDEEEEEEDNDEENDAQNTNESVDVAMSSTSLNPLPYTICPFPPIGIFGQPVQPPPMLPSQLGPYVAVGPSPGVSPIAPVQCLQMSMQSRLLPPPTTGLQQLAMPTMISYSRPGPIGSMAPMAAGPTMETGPMHGYSNVPATYQCSPGQSTCLPMFFPSETSFQMSTSPSDANLATSQMTLAGCPSMTLAGCPSMMLNSQPYPPNVLAAPPISNVSNGNAPNVPNNAAIYPVVYVSPAGLLTVLMRDDVAVEMTLDRAIRVVNHRHKAVAATNGRGNASCIHHTAAKIYQDRTTTQLELYDDRRANMTTEDIVFGLGAASGPSAATPGSEEETGLPTNTSYRLTKFGLVPSPNQEFADLSQDQSVTLLFSSSGYGPHLITQYEEVAQASRYRFYRNGAVTVYINGVRVHQIARGDVIVASGRKYLRVSSKTGMARVVTHFVEMTVEQNWTVRLRRGGHRLLATSNLFLLANDKYEFGFDMYRRPFLQPLSERQETIICRLGGGGGPNQNKSVIEPQSSDSRLLQQCMVMPSYSNDSTDWPGVVDIGAVRLPTNSRKLWPLAAAPIMSTSTAAYEPNPVPSIETFSAAGDSEAQISAIIDFCQ